jgi:uroporphyrinogen III methyltransferase / synthase
MPVRTGAERPLTGIGVVVTREDVEGGVLAGALRQYGANVLYWPTIRWAPVDDPTPLDAALEGLGEFQWVVFTSPRAVEAVAARGRAWITGPRIAAVGGATRAAAESHGWKVDVVPSVQTAEALVDALKAAGVGAGARVLLPASEIAGETVEAGLREAGAEVVRVTAYRTVPADLDRQRCARALAAGEVQVISFASPSAVESLRAGLGARLFDEVVDDVVVAVIGPTTAAAAEAAGASRVIQAWDHSLAGLAHRIAEWGRDHARGAR